MFAEGEGSANVGRKAEQEVRKKTGDKTKSIVSNHQSVCLCLNIDTMTYCSWSLVYYMTAGLLVLDLDSDLDTADLIIMPVLYTSVYCVLQSQKIATGYANNEIHQEADKIDI